MSVISEVPTMYLEVVTTGESGYVRDDTAGTAHEETINCAEVTFIPNRGKMAEEILDESNENKSFNPKRYRNVEISYIKDCPYIKVEDQKKFGYERNKIATVDSIVIKKGKALIKREGDVALYDYIMNVFYNLSAPNRPKTAKALIKVVEIEKNISTRNEDKFLQARAITFVETLVIKTGQKYQYKESKIDNILTALKLFGGDNYSDKIRVLTEHAEKFPKEFLDIVSKLDNVTMTEITHALELDIIHFEGGIAQYVSDKKVVATITTEAKSQNKKIEALSDILQTPEYAQAYQELRAKLEIAKEKSLKA